MIQNGSTQGTLCVGLVWRWDSSAEIVVGADPNCNLADTRPEVVLRMAEAYEAWLEIVRSGLINKRQPGR